MDSGDESQSNCGNQIPPSRPGPVMSPERRRLIQATKNLLHDDAKDNGFKAQARREIDQHRAGEGREAYNERRKRERRDKAIAETGEPPRAYMKGMAPEHRKVQVAAAKAKHLASRTAEQIADDKRKKAEQEKARRARKKAEANALPEGFGKF